MAKKKTAKTANAFFGLYEPIPVPWIGGSGLSGGSDLSWYLFGDPADVAAFGIAYLDGMEEPVVEEDTQPFNKLGVQLREYFDFGVTQIDHRGGTKANGS